MTLGVGLGTGVGLSGVSRISDETYYGRTAAIFGASFVGGYIGKDLVLSGSDVTSWPGRGAMPMLTNYPTGRFASQVRYGRRCLSHNEIDDVKCLYANYTGTARTAIVVASAPATKSTFLELCRIQNTEETLVSVDGSSFTWTSRTHYRNGVLSQAITPAKFAVYEGYATSASNYLLIGGEPVLPRAWKGDVAALFFLTGAPTATQRALHVSLSTSWIPEIGQ